MARKRKPTCFDKISEQIAQQDSHREARRDPDRCTPLFMETWETKETKDIQVPDSKPEETSEGAKDKTLKDDPTEKTKEDYENDEVVQAHKDGNDNEHTCREATKETRAHEYHRRQKVVLKEINAIKDDMACVGSEPNPPPKALDHKEFFYATGYYDEEYPYFGIKEEAVEDYRKRQEEWRDKWKKKHPETFSDQFHRYFWPPKPVPGKLMKGMSFTRGSYMDTPEVQNDPPAQVFIDFERDRRDIMSVNDRLIQATLPPSKKVDKKKDKKDKGKLDTIEIDAAEKTQGTAIEDDVRFEGDCHANVDDKPRNRVYWDDAQHTFLQKSPCGRYFFDTHTAVWREVSEDSEVHPIDYHHIRKAPYDYYYDNGQFHPRNEDNIDFYTYDRSTNIWLRTPAIDEESPTKKPYSINDFVFNEKMGHWQRRTPDDGSILFKYGMRRVIVGRRGRSGLYVDDFFFDDKSGRFIRKTGAADNYAYNPEDGVWRHKNAAPHDREAHGGLTPKHYYFDDDEGSFVRLPPTKPGQLVYNSNYHLWRLRGKLPTDFYWDEAQEKYIDNTLSPGIPPPPDPNKV